jgi:hypothetical protein
MRNRAFNFEVVYLPSQPKLQCKFITSTNESITISGDTIEHIYAECVRRYPDGLRTKAILFSGVNAVEAKRHFCALLSLGLKTGYFKDSDFGDFGKSNDGEKI